MKNENYITLAEEAYEKLREAREAAIEYITRIVKKHGGEVVFDMDYDVENVTILYDGGNHPEYASNCYSTVYRVYEENGEVLLETEDSSGYSFDRMRTGDIIDVADAIYKSADLRITEEESETEEDDQ